MTGVDPGLVQRVRARLASSAGGVEGGVGAVADAVRAESAGVVGDTDMLAILRELETELTGAGILSPLLADPRVSDVLVNGPSQVWVDRGAGLARAPVSFPDEAAVRRLAQRLALAAGRRLDDAQPWVDGRLAGADAGVSAVRMHAVLAPVAIDGTCISLRVLRPATDGLDALAGTGAIAPAALRLLRAIIAARLSFLVVGGTGAGKTTLLAALLGQVDPVQRIICVEDAPELAPRHPQVVRMVARPPNVEGAGAVSLRDLVRQALRMRPDRIVVGEVRGAEVVDMLTALNTGHDGGGGTVHANSPFEVPARLEALAAAGGMDRAALHSQLTAAVQVVLHVRRLDGGRRELSSIAVLARGADGAEVVPAWTVDAGAVEGFPALARLLADRGQGGGLR